MNLQKMEIGHEHIFRHLQHRFILNAKCKIGNLGMRTIPFHLYFNDKRVATKRRNGNEKDSEEI